MGIFESKDLISSVLSKADAGNARSFLTSSSIGTRGCAACSLMDTFELDLFDKLLSIPCAAGKLPLGGILRRGQNQKSRRGGSPLGQSQRRGRGRPRHTILHTHSIQ